MAYVRKHNRFAIIKKSMKMFYANGCFIDEDFITIRRIDISDYFDHIRALEIWLKKIIKLKV